MLERVWRKENPLTLLVGMQTGTATVENSLEIPLKLVHWDDPEGWNGEGGGRRVQDGEHM